MEFKRIAEIAAGTSMALTAAASLPVFYNDLQHRQTVETAYENAKAAACGGDPAYNQQLHTGDKAPLPPLNAENYRNYDVSGIASIGSIVITTDTISWKDGKSPLPTPYAEGFDESFQDPYIACTAQENYRHITLKVHKDGIDYPGFAAADGNTQAEPEVVMAIGAGAGPDGQLFSQKGTIREILTHENTHAVVDAWMHSENPQTKTLLRELEQLCRQESQTVHEAFRDEYGSEVIVALQSVRDDFKKVGQKAIVDGIDTLIARYGQPHGLDDLVLYQSDTYTDFLSSARLDMQIINAVRSHGQSASELAYDGVDLQPLTDIQAGQQRYFRQAYSYINEGSVIDLGNGTGGHADLNMNERIASTIASMQLAPNEVMQRVRQIEPTRRTNIYRQRALIADLFRIENPSLLQFMHIDELVSQQS